MIVHDCNSPFNLSPLFLYIGIKVFHHASSILLDVIVLSKNCEPTNAFLSYTLLSRLHKIMHFLLINFFLQWKIWCCALLFLTAHHLWVFFWCFFVSHSGWDKHIILNCLHSSSWYFHYYFVFLIVDCWQTCTYCNVMS